MSNQAFIFDKDTFKLKKREEFLNSYSPTANIHIKYKIDLNYIFIITK